MARASSAPIANLVSQLFPVALAKNRLQHSVVMSSSSTNSPLFAYASEHQQQLRSGEGRKSSSSVRVGVSAEIKPPKNAEVLGVSCAGGQPPSNSSGISTSVRGVTVSSGKTLRDLASFPVTNWSKERGSRSYSRSSTRPSVFARMEDDSVPAAFSSEVEGFGVRHSPAPTTDLNSKVSGSLSASAAGDGIVASPSSARRASKAAKEVVPDKKLADIRQLFEKHGVDAYIVPSEDAHQSEFMAEEQTNASGGKMVPVRDTVELTDMEERIFGILTETLNHFGLETQLRVAGGWVRDKLLGRTSIDIDIALDDMLGRIFCEKVNEYLRIIGEEVHTVGVIASNPDQSKHLETANMRVLGIPIDFVNLRAETYTETSRIPAVEFGTPEQDAERRDLTINSLFYNINTKMVEDFTEKGIRDLKLGIIRTPLPPDTTFLDDPLRVLRSIRFGARFNFALDEELKIAAASEAVRIALENKVSRERIGHEVELMIMGNQPERAMKHVEDLFLFSAVFRVPEEQEPDPPILENYGRLCVNALQAVTRIFAKITSAPKMTNEHRRLLLFGALFLPLHPGTCFADTRKKKKIALSRYIISESLKLKNNDASGIETLHTTALKFQPLIKKLLQLDLDSLKDSKDSLHHADSESEAVAKHRVELGLVLMSSRELWRGALLLASALELPSLKSQKGADIVGLSSDNQAWIDEKVETCNAVEDIVIKLGLNNVWETKPFLDGHQIMDILNLGKTGGKQVQEWKDKALRWQLALRHGTLDECKEWILEENVKRLKTQ